MSILLRTSNSIHFLNLLFHFGLMLLLISEGFLFCRRLKLFVLWQMEMFIHVEWATKRVPGNFHFLSNANGSFKAKLDNI